MVEWSVTDWSGLYLTDNLHSSEATAALGWIRLSRYDAST